MATASHVPRALAVNGSHAERNSSFRALTSSNSKERNGLPQPTSLMRRLPMRSSNSFLSFGVRHALSSTCGAECGDESSISEPLSYVPHVPHTSLREHPQDPASASRATIRQSAFSSSLAGCGTAVLTIPDQVQYIDQQLSALYCFCDITAGKHHLGKKQPVIACVCRWLECLVT